MNYGFLQTARKSIKYWWLSLIIGLLSFGFGVFCIFQPLEALISFTICFIIVFFIAGIMEIVFAIVNKNRINGWGWTMANGIIDIALGALLVIIPISAPIIMIYFVGFWIMFQSFWGLGLAFDLQSAKVKGWIWFLLLSVLGIIFSFTFIVNPEIGGSFIITMGALAFITYGILRIALSFIFKSFKDEFEEYEIGEDEEG